MLSISTPQYAHAYALALKKMTGVAIESVLPVPKINLDKIPECQKYLGEGSHRRLYSNSPSDYGEILQAFGRVRARFRAIRRASWKSLRGHPMGRRSPKATTEFSPQRDSKAAEPI